MVQTFSYANLNLKAHITRIPEDVFLIVIQTLEVWDILSLKQTCRLLHEICSLSSIWYHFYKHLPLESKWHDFDVASVTNSSWQSIVLQTIRADHNWKRPSPQLRKLRQICNGTRSGIANHVRLFNRGDALLWVSYPSNRSQNSHSSIAVWDISASETPQKRWSFDSLGFGSFFDLYEGSGRVVFAYGGDEERMHGRLMIHEFNSDLSGDVKTFGPFKIEGVPGTAEAVSVFGDIATIMLVDFNRGLTDTDGHKVVIVNWKTRASVQINPVLPLDFTRVGIQLYAHYYILYWQRNETASVELHVLPELKGPSTKILPAVPPACYQRHEALSTFLGRSWSLKLLITPRFLNLHETESIPPLTSCLLFPSITRPSPIEHYTLPIVHKKITSSESESESGTYSMLTFGTTIKHSIGMTKFRCCPRKLCVGPSGRRAVWLEQDFDSDNLELRLVRLAPESDGTGFNAKELKPNTLPFLASEIHCMAFDEVTTRLVLSLIQGDIWVLDFA